MTASVFQPASEQGQKGMDELHEQTVNLLSFQQLPKNIYDAQVAFNLVGRYGDRALSPSFRAGSHLSTITSSLPETAHRFHRFFWCRRRFSMDTPSPSTWKWRKGLTWMFSRRP